MHIRYRSRRARRRAILLSSVFRSKTCMYDIHEVAHTPANERANWMTHANTNTYTRTRTHTMHNDINDDDDGNTQFVPRLQWIQIHHLRLRCFSFREFFFAVFFFFSLFRLRSPLCTSQIEMCSTKILEWHYHSLASTPDTWNGHVSAVYAADGTLLRFV